MDKKQIALAATCSALIAAAAGLGVMYSKLRSQRRKVAALVAQEHEAVTLRDEERAGRIRAEKELRKIVQDRVAEEGLSCKPVGFVRSCYRERNGTPRQGCLVPDGRGVLVFRPELNPAAMTDGIKEFSHVWLVYVFHENTNAARSQGVRQGAHDMVASSKATPPIKAKVRPPRLGDKKVGLFATRTPHRPNPIGLSLVRLDSVDKDGSLHLSGLDLVDGTPVLDVKPFLPGYDLVSGSSVRVADWLHAPSVAELGVPRMTPEAEQQLKALEGKFELYQSSEDLKKCLLQILTLDIRSHHRRSRQDEGSENPTYSLGIDTVSAVFEVIDETAVIISVEHWPRGVKRPHINHTGAAGVTGDKTSTASSE